MVKNFIKYIPIQERISSQDDEPIIVVVVVSDLTTK